MNHLTGAGPGDAVVLRSSRATAAVDDVTEDSECVEMHGNDYPRCRRAGEFNFMSDLYHECGVAAIYHLPGREVSPLCPIQGPDEVSRLVPRMLLDIQNRGQLSAGMTSFNPIRSALLSTYKEVGGVSE